MKKRHYYLIFSICLLLFTSCEDPDANPKALLNLILVDNPAIWDSVFVSIEGVDIEILVEGRETQTQIFFLEYKSGDKRIKVSDLVGGNELLLGRNELPIGQIVSAKIILGEDHAMFLNKKNYKLELSDPSLKEIFLTTSMDIERGISYDMILDLDLEKSIKLQSESPLTYKFEPSFTLIKGLGTGKISGTLKPIDLYSAIYLIEGIDSISTHVNPSGKYSFRAQEGSYNIFFDAKDDLYLDTAFTIDIFSKEDSVIRPITFKKKP